VRVWNVGLIALLFVVGCGGGSSPGTGGGIGGITIDIISPAGVAAVDSGLTLPITVKVNNDSGNAGVIWTVAAQQKGNPSGSLSDVQATSVTYNPPAAIASAMHVTVTATSVTDPTRSVTLPIAVYPALAVPTQSSDLSTAFVNTSYTCVQKPITNAGVIQIPCQVTVTGGLAPYTWSVDPNTLLPDGMFLGPGLTANDTKIVGVPTTAGIYPFKLNAADSLGGTTAVSLVINVAQTQLKVVTPTILTTKVGAPYAPVQMQVSGGVPPYTWTLAPGSGPLPPGMALSPTGVIAGTPTVGTPFSFAVRVTDSQIPVPAEATFPAPAPSNGKIITLTASTEEPPCAQGFSGVAPNTPYAFLFTGFDTDGPVTLSGSFTADNAGSITGGVADIIRRSGVQLAQPLTPGSSVVFDSDGRGCMVLNTATTSAQFRAWPTTKDPSTGSYRDGRMVEFDDTGGTGTRGLGLFRIQDSSAFAASLAGPYAFRLAGWNSSGGRFAIAGVETADAGQFTSVSADVNNAGALSGPLSGGNGTFSAADDQGRGTATIAVGSAVYDLIYYIVDAQHVLFSSPHAASVGHPSISGEATTAAPGPFSPSSLSDSHIYRLGGAVGGSPDLNIGIAHYDGVASVSGTTYARTAGSATNTALTGQYAIDTLTGRFTFSGTAIPAVGYLALNADGLTGYLVGTGASATSGQMEFQTNTYPPGYLSTPVINSYGVAPDEMFDFQQPVFVGKISPNSANSQGGINDSILDGSTPGAGLFPFQTFELFRYAWSPDGSGTMGGNTSMVTNGHKFFYIDISPLNTHPAVIIGQQQEAP